MENIIIRNVEEKDYEFILKINEENVEVLSPMDEKKLHYFVEIADLFLLVEVDGNPAAFLIGLREGDPRYDSENYIWFSENYDKFFYIDRIVIDEPYRHLGLGSKLYKAVFDHARATGIKSVTCEVDTVPYNAPSLKFHSAMGFREVGVQVIRGGKIEVSLQEATVE